MARIIYPESFLVQKDLFDNVSAKHILDDKDSILLQFFALNSINWPDHIKNAAAALAKHKLAEDKRTDADEFISHRDALMAKNWDYVIKWIDFLKKTFPKNKKFVEEFGVTVTKSGKTTYPTEVVKRMDILDKLLKKHNSYKAPDVSPLTAFNAQHKIDITAVQADMAAILQAQKDYLKTNGESTTAIADRNLLWKPINGDVHLAGDYLVSFFHDNPMKVEEWGYQISLDPAPDVLRTSIIQKGVKVVRPGLKINGILENIGTVDLLIWAGKNGKGAPITLKAGEKMGILKGMSTITVENMSTLEDGKIQYTCSK